MKAKIFVFDIETAPNLADVWNYWNTNVGINQVRKNGRMIMWAGKYLHDKKMYSMNEIDDGQEATVKGLSAHFEDTDILVGHNGDGFDIKWLNWELLKHELPPPDPSKTVDTLKTCRKRFKLPSYKLDYICPLLGLGKKVGNETGHRLWIDWEAKTPKAKKNMIKYCKNDVMMLQRLYYKIRPWISNHPNMGLYDDKGRPTCPNCGGTKVVKKGLAYTNAGVYQRWRCKDCGTPLRGKTMMTDVIHRKNALTQEK